MKDTVHPHHLKFPEYSLKGVSTAGIGTCITIPEWKICFDMAQGLPFAFPMNHFLISHFHQDHASGIPYVISQKAMAGHKPPRFYMPQGTAEPMREIMRIWSRLEDHSYDFEFHELKPEAPVQIQPSLYVEAFRTLHRVTSQGYTVQQKQKKLKAAFVGLDRDALLRAKSQGQAINEDVFVPKISFTGDTQIEFLDLSPQVVHSETLIMEVTYMDEKRGVESARKWGHIHFNEILSRIPRIQSKNIVLIHLSARHHPKEFRALIDRKLPEDKDRIHIL